MKKERINIKGIPSIIWGEKSTKVFIAVHGDMSNKEDEVIKIFADIATNKGYQVLSLDLPEHGERAENKEYLCKVQNCVNDLNKIMKYAKSKYENINLWACSMGAYFSLLTYKDDTINKCIFLSPVVNMKVIIDYMMMTENVTEKDLEDKREIHTNSGQTLYFDYYKYVKENPITYWDKETYFLYGNKDNMQNKNLIEEFTNNFNCNLNILENGEHYFHTDEQLSYYENWLNYIV